MTTKLQFWNVTDVGLLEMCLIYLSSSEDCQMQLIYRITSCLHKNAHHPVYMSSPITGKLCSSTRERSGELNDWWTNWHTSFSWYLEYGNRSWCLQHYNSWTNIKYSKPTYMVLPRFIIKCVAYAGAIFHRAASPLNWYKRLCMEDILNWWCGWNLQTRFPCVRNLGRTSVLTDKVLQF